MKLRMIRGRDDDVLAPEIGVGRIGLDSQAETIHQMVHVGAEGRCETVQKAIPAPILRLFGQQQHERPEIAEKTQVVDPLRFVRKDCGWEMTYKEVMKSEVYLFPEQRTIRPHLFDDFQVEAPQSDQFAYLGKVQKTDKPQKNSPQFLKGEVVRLIAPLPVEDDGEV